MKRTLILAVVAAGTAWLACGLTGDGRAEGKGDLSLGCFRLSGTWLGELEIGGVPAAEVLYTFCADGTMVAGGNPLGDSVLSAMQGAWKRTGLRDFRGTMLMFMRDLDGGILFYEKAPFEISLVGENEFEGAFEIELFAPDQDPLDPAEIPFYETTGTFRGRRIVAD
jgi:hypothetical protein